MVLHASRVGPPAAILAAALATTGCLRLGLQDVGRDGGESDADGDGDEDSEGGGGDGDGSEPPRVGWDLSTLEASTRVTGQGRVEVRVGLGDEATDLSWGEWTSLDGARALGAVRGRFLGLRVRLLSPDGLSRAALGPVTVVGTGGRERWLVFGEDRVAWASPGGVEPAHGGFVLARAPVGSGAALPADAFAGPALDGRLWSDLSDGRARPRVADGRLAASFVVAESLESRLESTYDLVGDCEVRVTHEAPSWPLVTGGARVFSGLEATVSGGLCRLWRRAQGGHAEVVLLRDGTVVQQAPDPGGALVLVLERAAAQVRGHVERPDGTGRVDLGACSGGADGPVSLFFGSAGGSGAEPVSIAYSSFEVLRAGAVSGVDRSGPELALELGDALAPHVEASPESGAFEGPVEVALGTSSPGARILFTLDGSEPLTSPARLVYDRPVRLDSSALLSARAVDAGGHAGPAIHHVYVVGELLARAPFDGPDEGLVESVHGWDGTVSGVGWVVDGVVGGAAHFDGLGAHGVLPDSSTFGSDAYRVDEGGLSLWIRPERLTGVGAPLSKDSSGFDSGGHLTLTIEDGEVVVRLQSTEEHYYVRTTAAPLRPGEWQRLTVGFGRIGLSLLLSDRSGRLLGSWSTAYEGGLGPSSGGEGNREPILVGASSWVSGDLTHLPLCRPFAGDVDELSLVGTR